MQKIYAAALATASPCVWSRFMIKWAIAAIPAFIILWIIMVATGMIIAFAVGGIGHLFRR